MGQFRQKRQSFGDREFMELQDAADERSEGQVKEMRNFYLTDGEARGRIGTDEHPSSPPFEMDPHLDFGGTEGFQDDVNTFPGIPDNFTIEVVFRFDSPSSTPTTQYLLCINEDAVGKDGALQVVDDGLGNGAEVRYHSSSGYTSWNVSSFLDGDKHTLSVLLDIFTGEAELYVDGTSQGTVLANIPPVDQGVRFSLGADFDDNDPFDGEMHQLRVWTKLLSPSEIVVGERSLPSDQSDLYAFYDMHREPFYYDYQNVGVVFSGVDDISDNDYDLDSQFNAGDVEWGFRFAQGVFHFEETDGTRHIVVISDEELWELTQEPGSNQSAQWTSRGLKDSSVQVDPTEQVDGVEYNGQLVVTDGVNTPWKWDPSTGGNGTYTVLSDAPVCRQLEVYYGKLFCLDQPNNPPRLSWSEEWDATTGYSAKNYVWDYGQTDFGRITGAAALNEALVVFKEDSINAIRGAVTSDFKTSAVREGISTNIGAVDGNSIVIVEENIFFMSEQGPRVLAGGQKLQDITKDQNGKHAISFIWDYVTDQNGWRNNVHGWYDSEHNQVLWTIKSGGADKDQQILGYDLDSRAFFIWQFPFYILDVAHMEAGNGDPLTLFVQHDGIVSAMSDTHDYWGNNAAWDRYHGSQEAIQYQLGTRFYGLKSHTMDKLWTRLELTASGNTELELSPDYYESAGTPPSKTATLSPNPNHQVNRTDWTWGMNIQDVAIGISIVQENIDMLPPVIHSLELTAVPVARKQYN